jgi:hypothetical protein
MNRHVTPTMQRDAADRIGIVEDSIASGNPDLPALRPGRPSRAHAGLEARPGRVDRSGGRPKDLIHWWRMRPRAARTLPVQPSVGDRTEELGDPETGVRPGSPTVI